MLRIYDRMMTKCWRARCFDISDIFRYVFGNGLAKVKCRELWMNSNSYFIVFRNQFSNLETNQNFGDTWKTTCVSILGNSFHLWFRHEHFWGAKDSLLIVLRKARRLVYQMLMSIQSSTSFVAHGIFYMNAFDETLYWFWLILGYNMNRVVDRIKTSALHCGHWLIDIFLFSSILHRKPITMRTKKTFARNARKIK